MGRFGRDDDAPRVVGFDFGPPVPPVAPPVAPPLAPPAVPEHAAAARTTTMTPPIGTYQPPAAYQPGVPPAPFRPAPPAPQAKFKREVTVIAVLFGLLAAGGIVQRLTARGPEEPTAPVSGQAAAPVSLPPLLEDLNAPATIGGAPRLATRHSKAIATAWRQKLPNKGRHSEIEVYGSRHPEYVIVAGEITSGTSTRMFQVITKGERIAWGPLRAYAGGLVCTTMRFDGVRGSLCAWSGAVSDGAVAGYEQPDPAALAKTTRRARADLERGRS